MEVLNLLAAPVTEVVKCCVPHVRRRIGYLVHYKKNIHDLGNKVVELGSTRDDIQRSVEAAEMGGQVIKNVVKLWLADVDTVEKEVKRLIQAAQIRGLVIKEKVEEWMQNTVGNGEVQNIDGCFNARYSLGKEAKEKIVIVDELLKKGKFDSVSDPPPPLSIESMPTGDFWAFESTKLAMTQVMEALRDETIKIIGLHGMGGVGKTSLMQQVAQQVKKDKIFDEVVMVTVSQNPVLTTIQGEIAEKLGLELQVENESSRAGRLYDRLVQINKRTLMILDDLWDRLDLVKVGIPDHNCCKVVLTTRREAVCNTMMTQKNIPVEVLSAQDAWLLFQKNVGDVVNSPALHEVAWKVVKECGNLPIALVTLGRALRGKDDKIVWEDVATKLRKSMPKDIEGMEKEVFNSIKLSYDFLESEETKKCFLFCCLFPEDHKILINEELMMYVMGEALLEDVDYLVEARARLHTVVDILRASCLLLKGDTKSSVKMHDIVRDVAIYISKEDEGFIVKAGMGLRQWLPEGEKLGKCMRLSLMYNNIAELPSRPECPQLLTLSMRNNRSLRVIPHCFFESMKSLVTLDLSYTSISSLPPSLSCLVNLRALYLEDCKFPRDVSVIGKLKNLEILNLCGRSNILSWILQAEPKIQSLPKEIGGMTNLKLLNLSYTRHLKIIPPNVISSLSCLEELYMERSFSGWEIERMGDGSKARFSEVTSLTCLTTLYLDIQNVKCISKEVPNCWKNLTNFKIRVGARINAATWWSGPCYMIYGAPWSLKCISLDFTSDPIPNWVKVLLQRIDKLELKDCKGCKNVLQLDAWGFNNLKSFELENFLETTFICLQEAVLNSEGVEEGHAMTSRLREDVLQTTTSTRLRRPDLSSSPSPPIFSSLKDLLIRDCPRLKHLFPMRLVRGLQQLEKLEICKCDQMEEIIVNEEEGKEVGDEDKKVLPRLKILRLESLKKLSSFFQWKLLLDWPAMETLRVINCPNLKRLPLAPHSAHKLREVIGFMWLEGMEWEDKSRIQCLFLKEN